MNFFDLLPDEVVLKIFRKAIKEPDPADESKDWKTVSWG